MDEWDEWDYESVHVARDYVICDVADAEETDEFAYVPIEDSVRCAEGYEEIQVKDKAYYQIDEDEYICRSKRQLPMEALCSPDTHSYTFMNYPEDYVGYVCNYGEIDPGICPYGECNSLYGYVEDTDYISSDCDIACMPEDAPLTKSKNWPCSYGYSTYLELPYSSFTRTETSKMSVFIKCTPDLKIIDIYEGKTDLDCDEIEFDCLSFRDIATGKENNALGGSGQYYVNRKLETPIKYFDSMKYAIYELDEENPCLCFYPIFEEDGKLKEYSLWSKNILYPWNEMQILEILGLDYDDIGYNPCPDSYEPFYPGNDKIYGFDPTDFGPTLVKDFEGALVTCDGLDDCIICRRSLDIGIDKGAGISADSCSVGLSSKNAQVIIGSGYGQDMGRRVLVDVLYGGIIEKDSEDVRCFDSHYLTYASEESDIDGYYKDCKRKYKHICSAFLPSATYNCDFVESYNCEGGQSCYYCRNLPENYFASGFDAENIRLA
ncbi:MAG: hypothetical protein KKF44_02075 [Nanoarchaeota archaeon]|nr:hypothetical protein [Nanoarchaeota archaeon]